MRTIPPPLDEDLRVSDFQYALPPGAIAQAPTQERELARLMVLEPQGAAPEHHVYGELPDLVRGDELFVLNDTRVVRARLRARKPSGGRVELLVTGPDPQRPDAMLALTRSSKPLRVGACLELDGGPSLELLERHDGGLASIAFAAGDEGSTDLWSLLERHGELPLPPYIERPHGPTPADLERYQTVFAERPGSSAAPTAGLHFTPSLLAALEARGCELARLTLHVGPGTFQPVRSETLSGHVMHHERFEISEETAKRVRDARAAGRPVVAVGTTVVRTLEAVAQRHGRVVAARGSTDLFITPGFSFEVVDQLLTNYHLPGSTLLMLVSALAGRERILEAYNEALSQGYRFFSYGDGMWIR